MFSTLVAAILASAGVIAAPACALVLPTSNHTTRASISSPLLPVSPQKKFWTTDPDLPNSSPLSDATFRPHNQITALSHAYVKAPDGRLSMKAHFPAGSYTFTHTPPGGVSFYAPGPASVDLSTAKEATLGYTVYFPSGFDFVKGGKLPGLYGGDSDSEAVSCSGGRRDDGCFSARFMWRTNGAGELYTYLPPDYTPNQAVCDIPPFSTCNDVYGASVARGSFAWKTGGRTAISQRVRLNDVGKQNGELEVFFNGKSVINVGGLVLRDSSSGRIRGIQMQTFFGGGHRSDSSWATPVDQDIYFSDFSVAITETL
ncbi:Polysaccharide Lyase Family 14 protein [Trametes cinnabarina]|uniref:Polysaccharide Lyase Family 14 protein n=1 Tax=Pycnoporus cinnabarinus TaxID=5643 RepID=A0A060SC28_PYCCI|nr:Polysaccharide Lyase Family 14 protein [Trametes cinnabarina]